MGEGAEGLWSCAGSAVVVSQGSIPPGDLSAHSVHPGARIYAGWETGWESPWPYGVKAQDTDVVWPRVSGKVGVQAKEGVGGRLLTQDSHSPWAQKETPS